MTLGPVAFSGTSESCLWNEAQKVYTGANSWSTLSEALSREWPSFAGQEGPVFVPEEYFLSKVPEVIDYHYEGRDGFKCGEQVEAAKGIFVDKIVKKMDKKYKGEIILVLVY